MAIQGPGASNNTPDQTQRLETRANELFEQGENSLGQKAYTKANTLFHEALELFKKLHGESHARVISCYERLATSAHAEGKNPEMAAYALAALSLRPQT